METLSLLRFIGMQHAGAGSGALQPQTLTAANLGGGQQMVSPTGAQFINASELLGAGGANQTATLQLANSPSNQFFLQNLNGVLGGGQSIMPMSIGQLIQQQQQQQNNANANQSSQQHNANQQQQLLQQLQNNMIAQQYLSQQSQRSHQQHQQQQQQQYDGASVMSCPATIAGVKRPYREICSPASAAAVSSAPGTAVILTAPQAFSTTSESTNPYLAFALQQQQQQQQSQQQLVYSQNAQLNSSAASILSNPSFIKQETSGMLSTAAQTVLAAPATNGSSTNSSMSSCSPTQSSQNLNGDSDAKKVRLDGSVTPPLSAGTAASNSPSKVLHFRNVPSEASESEVIYLGLPFGVPSNVLLNKKGHQAFLEMPDEEAARRCVDFYGTNPKQALIRGQPVFIQFSNHRELRTDNNPTGQAALRATQAIKSGPTEDSAKCVLRVIIENYVYPVSIEILRSIFAKYGPVIKIVIFTKNNTFQALIQMGDPISALTAKMFLDGQNVFSGCDTLRIDFSKLTCLNIRFNNEKSMDYTNPNLPSGDQAQSPAATNNNAVDQFTLNIAASNQYAMNQSAANQAATIASLPASFFATGGPLSLTGATLTSNAPTASFASLHNAHSTINVGGTPGNSTPGAIPLSALSPVNMNMNAMNQVNVNAMNQAVMNQAQSAALAAAFGTNPAAVALPLQLAALAALNSVVHVSNLSEEKITPDALFTLFGVYGNVIRVKILFNKRDTALVQYSDAQAAQLAINYLNGVSVYGRPMHIVLSKNLNVQLPKEGQPDAGLTRDYTDSPLHRYKKPGSKNFNNIFPPSPVLHLSNIPPGISEEFLRQLFVDRSLTLTSFRFFPRDQKMALAQLASVDESVTALVELHNHPLNESHHLRVSFSKAQVGTSGASNAAGVTCASALGALANNGRATSTPSGSSAPPSPAATTNGQLLLYGSSLQV